MLRSSKVFCAGVGKWMVVLALALVLAGCDQAREAPYKGRELSDKDLAQLEQRVRERWLAQSGHDFAKVWEFSTPDFRRTFPKSLYIHKFSYGVNWELTGVKVLHYDARAAVASVVVRVMSEPTKLTSAASRAVGAVPMTVRERWIYIDGEWWFSANA